MTENLAYWYFATIAATVSYLVGQSQDPSNEYNSHAMASSLLASSYHSWVRSHAKTLTCSYLTSPSIIV